VAIDTRNKRSSAIHVSLPWRGQEPAPDGALSQADRQHTGLHYAGIAAGGAAAVVTGRVMGWPGEDTFNGPFVYHDIER
jgi:hypothetical protein